MASSWSFMSDPDFEAAVPAQGARPSVKNGRIPGPFRADQRTERLSAQAMLAEGVELSSNPHSVGLQGLSITFHQMD